MARKPRLRVLGGLGRSHGGRSDWVGDSATARSPRPQPGGKNHSPLNSTARKSRVYESRGAWSA
jgi:hypothetical protein